LPLSARFCAPPEGMPDEASNESMPGIVVVRGVVLVAPPDKVCESPGEGVSVALLGVRTLAQLQGLLDIRDAGSANPELLRARSS